MAEFIKKTYEGGCHCGSLEWKYFTAINPEDWEIRSCQCSFCKSHGAQCTSDPSGAVEFFVLKQSQLSRYSFGLRTADFLICKKCGVYIGAVIENENGCFTTINLKTMKTYVKDLGQSVPAFYDSEAEEDRIIRRQTKWTPVTKAI